MNRREAMEDDGDLTIVELIELERVGIQAIADTLGKDAIDVGPYRMALERLDQLLRAAQRGELTDDNWERERTVIWATIRAAWN